MTEKVFNNIEFDFDYEVFSKKIDLEKYKSMEHEVEAFIDKAIPKVQPKAIYRVSYVDDRQEETVVIEGTNFESKILTEKLKNIERVFPFIATCGQELEDLQKNENDQLKIYWIEKLKEMALNSTTVHLSKFIKDKYKIDQISSMNPGSADKEVWPLEQQQQFFSLFNDVTQKIGVKLTESHLMIPNKSVSGIYFPSDQNHINCEYCTREDCPSRRAPHDPGKWEEKDKIS